MSSLAVIARLRSLAHRRRAENGTSQTAASASPLDGEPLRQAMMILQSAAGLGDDDRDMVAGLLNLRELEVSDIMVHRTKMATLDASEPPETIVREVLASPFTRLPLWRDSPDNIVGVLHAKDLLRELQALGDRVETLDVQKIALPAWFVPDGTSASDQLKAFRRRKQHFALVVDEYGEVMGLVTLEDILEEIVGEIADEHDIAFAGARPHPDGSVSVEGSVAIRDLNRAMGWHLPDEEATTVAGLVIHEARIIPEPGQTFNFHGFRFQVMRKQRNRITLLRVSPLPVQRST